MSARHPSRGGGRPVGRSEVPQPTGRSCPRLLQLIELLDPWVRLEADEALDRAPGTTGVIRREVGAELLLHGWVVPAGLDFTGLAAVASAALRFHP